jgi:hypothetical protein
VTDHPPVPLADHTPDGEEPDSPADRRQERPRWYWPLFAAMLLALAVAAFVWPIVVFHAVVP